MLGRVELQRNGFGKTVFASTEETEGRDGRVLMLFPINNHY